MRLSDIVLASVAACAGFVLGAICGVIVGVLAMGEMRRTVR